MVQQYPAKTQSAMDGQRRQGAVVVQDTTSWLPLPRLVPEDDVILLLTPGIEPIVNPDDEHPETTTDPFEPLGKALAKYHPRVRHVPYLPRNRITGTHVVHIKLATNVVFVISGPPRHQQVSQVELADIVRTLAEHRPQIVVVCCNLQELGPLQESFPTIVQIPNYTPGELEAAADLIFRAPPNVQNLILAPELWTVEVWDFIREGSLLPAIYELWCRCFPESFKITQFKFREILMRVTYAKHFVVREPRTRDLLGFCATFTNFVDPDPEQPGSEETLIGSLAFVVVRSSYRKRGIGRSLHNFAVRDLVEVQKVARLQLGSTFPRLLYGIPTPLASEDWFKRRGWDMSLGAPGTGQPVCDWLLRFEDWPSAAHLSSDIIFGACELKEIPAVLNMVAAETYRKNNFGWNDLYRRMTETIHFEDLVVGRQGDSIVAVAMTYVQNSGSPISDELPWLGTIGPDVGGVTCICIADRDPAVVDKKDQIMIRLLDWCIRMFAERELKSLFIDGVRGGNDGFQSMGFQRWAQYKDIWRTTR